MSSSPFNQMPQQTIYHGTVDISKFVVSTRFTQRENAVTDLEFTVTSEDMNQFSIGINDRISVAYDDDINGNRKVFDGYIENKAHSLSSQGETIRFFATDSVCAVLKRMIVNLDFGFQSRIGLLNPSVDQKLSNAVLQILHDYVARVSGNPINQTKPNSFSEFKTNYWINDGYIWQETNSIKFPYLSMKYCNALEAVTNLVKLYGALSFKRAIDTQGQVPYRGVHWISDAENNLIVAPVGNHDVASTTGNQIAGLWHTYANNGTVLTIGEDPVISFDFVEEAPLANLVYVAGKYVFPYNEAYTENNPRMWGCSVYPTGGGTNPNVPAIGAPETIPFISNSTIAKTKGDYSLKLMSRGALVGNHTIGWNAILPNNGWDIIGDILSTNSDPSLFYTEVTGEFTKLISEETPAYINFTAYADPNTTNHCVLLFNTLGNLPANTSGFLCNFNPSYGEVSKQSIEISMDDLSGIGKWRAFGSNPNWDTIRYLGFTFRHEMLFSASDRSLYIDDLSLSGNMIRGATDSNMWTLTTDTGDGYWIRNRTMNPAYKYPLRMFTIRDSLAFSDNLLVEPMATDSLYLSALAHLIQYGSPMIKGTLSIPINTNYLAGQFLRVKNNLNSNWYKDSNNDYKTFRITSVTHSFSSQGAITTLEVCNDLINGTPRSNNEYSEAVRALSPKHQDATFSSLYTENAWDNDAYIAASRVNLNKIDF